MTPTTTRTSSSPPPSCTTSDSAPEDLERSLGLARAYGSGGEDAVAELSRLNRGTPSFLDRQLDLRRARGIWDKATQLSALEDPQSPEALRLAAPLTPLLPTDGGTFSSSDVSTRQARPGSRSKAPTWLLKSFGSTPSTKPTSTASGRRSHCTRLSASLTDADCSPI